MALPELKSARSADFSWVIVVCPRRPRRPNGQRDLRTPFPSLPLPLSLSLSRSFSSLRAPTLVPFHFSSSFSPLLETVAGAVGVAGAAIAAGEATRRPPEGFVISVAGIFKRAQVMTCDYRDYGMEWS
ncbi:uncharacterized protein LOC120112524 [Phoenix dactylifera]|uniref:Uncharacterized protein LOC120112524 n=1 Tax=Phoenix dactylifera TaxID=42345 RepID=A0A8B9AX92_PHODC|nr:uncharacterized protein LOC120112524 [Phoenix dactylifera]